MNKQSDSIKIIRSALDLLYFFSIATIPEKNEIERVQDRLNKILEIDPMMELDHALNILQGKPDKQTDQIIDSLADSAKRIKALNAEKAHYEEILHLLNDDQGKDQAAILNYYESQMSGDGLN